MVSFRSRPVVVGILAGTALAAIVGVAPAQAHNSFVSSTPATGSVVTEQPGTFVITTSDALLDSGPDSPTTFLQVSGPGDTPLYYGDGCATVAGASITMPVQLGEAGEYRIAWGVVSADGHPITSAASGGDIIFTWQPADGQEIGSGFAAPPTCGQAPAASETPAPEETEAAPVAPSDTATTAPVAESDDASTAAATILWIGLGLGVLVVAAIVVLVVVRRRAPSAEPADAASEPGDPPAAV